MSDFKIPALLFQLKGKASQMGRVQPQLSPPGVLRERNRGVHRVWFHLTNIFISPLSWTNRDLNVTPPWKRVLILGKYLGAGIGKKPHLLLIPAHPFFGKGEERGVPPQNHRILKAGKALSGHQGQSLTQH